MRIAGSLLILPIRNELPYRDSFFYVNVTINIDCVTYGVTCKVIEGHFQAIWSNLVIVISCTDGWYLEKELRM